MRLIDKEALCGLLADKALEAQLEDECTELAIKECLSVVRQMPEAVVRCKDCKHRFEDSWCEYVDDDDNFYCARGERKEGAD